MTERFKPTAAMHRCRAVLHRNCPPGRALKLTPAEPQVLELIRPTSFAQLQKWLSEYGEDFWCWLITDPMVDGNDLEARELAFEALREVFALPSENSEGETSLVNLRLKLDAAKLLLATKNPLVAIQNVNNAGEDLPRGLRGKTNSQIEERLAQLQKHTPQPQLTKARSGDTLDASLE